jgi:hypothetical protein
MALYARVEKTEEDERRVRYAYTDVAGATRILLLDKDAGTTSADDGVEDMLYRAVAGKVAAAWAHSGVAPDRLMVQS